MLKRLQAWNAKRVYNKYLIEFLWDDAETFEDVLEKFSYASLQKMRSGNVGQHYTTTIAFGEFTSAPITADGNIPILHRIQAELDKHPKTRAKTITNT